MEPLKIFIGYDEAESVAYHTLVQSIIEHASQPVSITPLKVSMLPEYTRVREAEQSNEFSFTRFLVPHLCGYQGTALFMDCDMLFRTDPADLFMQMEPDKSVMVVKHSYTPKDQVKYLGTVQYRYPRKNWSSVMLFNCEHEDCRVLTPSLINTASGPELQRLLWTDNESIGELSADWNHLVGEYAPNPKAKIVHFTIGGPYFQEYADVEYSEEWQTMNESMRHCMQLKKRKSA